MTTAIIDTSTANIASVRYALDRLGAAYLLAETPEDAASCDRILLPGVGAAGPAMKRLQQTGWASALKYDTRPLLGVCLGMQMLFEYSVESECELLGLIPGRIEKLDPGADGPWPHMGWNTLIDLDSTDPLLQGVSDGDHVYFVHGFYAPVSATTVATTQYGSAVTAIARHGHVAGCQFHPERSARVGSTILKNFVEGAA